MEVTDFQIEKRTLELINRCYNPNQITVRASSRFREDLGLTINQFVSFIMDVEDMFSVEFPDTEIHDMKTVGAVIAAVAIKKQWQ